MVGWAGGKFAPQLDQSGFAIVNSNRFFIGDQDTDQITEYDAAGNPLGLQFGNAGVGDCEGLGLVLFGNSLFVADDSNGRLVEFDLAGNFLGTFSLAALGVTGAIDPEGIAADSATDRFTVLCPNLAGQAQRPLALSLLVLSLSKGRRVEGSKGRRASLGWPFERRALAGSAVFTAETPVQL